MTEYVGSLLSAGDAQRLREAFEAASYTSAGLAGRIGAPAVAGLERGDPSGTLLAGGDETRMGTLLRVFVQGRGVSAQELAAALAPLPLASALAAGLIAPAETGQVRARVQLLPYQDRWFLADPPFSGRTQPSLDHVIGLSTYPATLAAAAMDHPVSTALDVCTGSGVQALHLARRADHVTATDLNPRALRFAATTAALAGHRWELLPGDLLAPVAGRRFDLVVANPPFIVKPGTVDYLYRDSGLENHVLASSLVQSAPRVLTDGGYLQYLSAFLHRSGQDWREQATGWVQGTDLDLYAIQLGVCDPRTYVRTWSGGHDSDPAEETAWLNWLTDQDIDAVGWGLVTVRNAHRDIPHRDAEDLSNTAVRAPDIATWFRNRDWLHTHTDQLLDLPYQANPTTRLTQHGHLDDHQWAIAKQFITTTSPTGLCRIDEINQITVDLLARCTLTTTPRALLPDLAHDNDLDIAELTRILPTAITSMIEHTILTPAPAPPIPAPTSPTGHTLADPAPPATLTPT